MSPISSAAGLALVVTALVAWVASALFTWPWLGALASLASFSAMSLLALYVWKRLVPKGRVLFGLPAVLVSVGLLLFPFVPAPWPLVVTGAGAAALLVAVVLGITPRAGMVSTQLNLMRGAIAPSLLRSDAPGGAITLRLDGDRLELGDETWELAMLAGARLEARARPVLRVSDRIGDEVAVEVDAESLAAAQELVLRISARAAPRSPR